MKLLMLCVLMLLAWRVDASLVVHKALRGYPAVEGQDLTVSVRLFNIGESTVYDISLDDEETWPESEYDIVVARPVANWHRLGAGENITHNFVVQPLRGGYHKDERAIVTYRPGAKEELKTTHSSTLGYFYVMSAMAYEKETSLYLREWGLFLAMSVVLVGVPGLYYLILNSVYGEDGQKRSKAKME